eukprot:3762327-Prymnesium_polylepis.1
MGTELLPHWAATPRRTASMLMTNHGWLVGAIQVLDNTLDDGLKRRKRPPSRGVAGPVGGVNANVHVVGSSDPARCLLNTRH